MKKTLLLFLILINFSCNKPDADSKHSEVYIDSIEQKQLTGTFEFRSLHESEMLYILDDYSMLITTGQFGVNTGYIGKMNINGDTMRLMIDAEIKREASLGLEEDWKIVDFFIYPDSSKKPASAFFTFLTSLSDTDTIVYRLLRNSNKIPFEKVKE